MKPILEYLYNKKGAIKTTDIKNIKDIQLFDMCILGTSISGLYPTRIFMCMENGDHEKILISYPYGQIHKDTIWLILSDYDKDFTFPGQSIFNIQEIYRPIQIIYKSPAQCFNNQVKELESQDRNMKLIWKR